MFHYHLTTVYDKEAADKIKRVVHNQTYMNFQVEVCPYQGQLLVNVFSDYDAPKDEIIDMLLDLLAQHIIVGR